MPWLLYLLPEYGSQTTLSSTPLPQSPTTLLCSLVPHFCPSWVFLVTLLSPSQSSLSPSSHGWTEDSPVTPFTQYSPGDCEPELEWEEDGEVWATPLDRTLLSKHKRTFPTAQGESGDMAGSHVGETVEGGSLEKVFKR